MSLATVHHVGPRYVRITDLPEQRFRADAVFDAERDRVRQERVVLVYRP